jgi:integrase
VPRPAPKPIEYGATPGTIRPALSGGWDAYVRVDGKRYRIRKDTLEEAKAWVIMTEEAAGAHRPPLSASQAADAGRALALLPAGYTLTDAARALAAATAPPDLPAVDLAAAVERFLADREALLSEATMRNYRSHTRRLAAMAGGCVGDVQPAAITAFLAGKGPVTRNNMLRSLSAFFAWSADEGLVRSSPLAKIRKATLRDSEIHVLTIDQAERLVGTAARIRPELVPYLAMALWTGIRPTELTRLASSKIGRDWILIDGDVSKKRRRRSVPVPGNLRAWLDAFPPPAAGRIFWSRRAFRAVLLAWGEPWHNDVCRHTFGTMRWDQIRDPIQVAAEMGNSPDVLMSAYRALVHPGDGAKFFNVWPQCALVCPTPVQRSA